MKKTPLDSVHTQAGARLVPFGGWSMPVQYRGILEEARAVRQHAGLFDLSHMGRVQIRGSDAEEFLQRLQTNDVTKIAPGRIRYAMILDEEGRTQDDILVYREPDNSGFFLVINAGNSDRDLGIMRKLANQFGDLRVEDVTEDMAMIALQGPSAEPVLQQVTDINLREVRYYAWEAGVIHDVGAAVSRTGYTGEDGFEVYLPANYAVSLWNYLIEIGTEAGVVPCGLGSRDILRLEAGMPLYGHEIDETTTPFDAGLDFAVKFTHDFIGRAALEKIQADGGPKVAVMGMVSDSRRVPRQGYPVRVDGKDVAVVCSGGSSPTLGKNIGTARIPREFAEPGREIEFVVRDKPEAATTTALPFYKRDR